MPCRKTHVERYHGWQPLGVCTIGSAIDSDSIGWWFESTTPSHLVHVNQRFKNGSSPISGVNGGKSKAVPFPMGV